MLDPIVKTIEVPCSQERAFEVFLNEMDSWWPLGKFTISAMRGAPAKAIRVEAKQSGKIVEIGPDGTLHLPQRLSLTATPAPRPAQRLYQLIM